MDARMCIVMERTGPLPTNVHGAAPRFVRTPDTFDRNTSDVPDIDLTTVPDRFHTVVNGARHLLRTAAGLPETV